MSFRILAASAIFASVPFTAAVDAAESAGGALIDADGKEIGTVELATLAAGGVQLVVSASGLPAGAHGYHIHETGKCEAEGGFKSAGGHYNPTGAEHGWQTSGGPHAGDMPNVHVQEDGVLAEETFLTSVSLDEGDPATLFDDDGSALVIHAGQDDYTSQPSGDAGDRLACAVIKPR